MRSRRSVLWLGSAAPWALAFTGRSVGTARAANPRPAVSEGARPGIVERLDRHVFVASRQSAGIALIDSDLDQVVGQATVAAPPHQYVLAEAGARLVASHLDHRSLTIFDLARMTIEAVVDPGVAPENMAMAPDGTSLAISSGGAGEVALVSLAERAVMQRLTGLAPPGDLMFDRDGELLFVASPTSDRVSVIDVARGVAIDGIDLRQPSAEPLGVQALARTPGGQVGLALHGESGRVSVLDLRERRQVGSVALPGPAISAFPTANSLYLMVPNERDRTVSLLSSWTLGEVDRLPGAADMSAIAAGMFDSVALVLSRAEDRAVVLDLDQRRQIGEIALPSRPSTAVAAQAGTKLYVALAGSDRVAVIDMRERRLVTTIDGVGVQPWGVAVAGGLSYCH